MKIIFTLLFALLLFGITELTVHAAESSISLDEKENIVGSVDYRYLSSIIDGDITYVRVLVDGKWYIYIYEGAELVDVVPE